MKIAVCISGQPRNVHKGFTHIQPNLLEGNDVDVFIHTWIDEEQVGKPYVSSLGEKISDSIPNNIFDEIVRLYDPVVILPDTPRDFTKNNYKAPPQYPVIRPFNTLSQKYSTMRAQELRQKFGKEYDAVVRLRFDYALNTKINFQSMNMDHINAPNRCGHPGGIDDTFAIGSPSHMTVYGDLFNHIQELYDSGVPFCDEILLGHYLAREGIPVKLHNFSYRLIRR